MPKNKRARRTDPSRDLEGELEAVYAEADAVMAAWSCDASTACCRFGVTGREPYVTSIELALLNAAVAARGGPLPAKRKALPLAVEERVALGGRRHGDERTCAMLDEHGRCSVYAARPLGCRTFFCDRATGPGRIPRNEIRGWVARIQAIAARHQPDGDRARPLSKAVG